MLSVLEAIEMRPELMAQATRGPATPMGRTVQASIRRVPSINRPNESEIERARREREKQKLLG